MNKLSIIDGLSCLCVCIYLSQKDTICPPGYYQLVNGLMVTHSLGHTMYGYTLLVHMNQSVLNELSKEHNKTS